MTTPGQTSDGNPSITYDFTSGEVLIKSDGTPWRPLVHIEDISRAFLAVLQAPREGVHNQAFNVGRPGENYQVRQIAERKFKDLNARDVEAGCRIIEGTARSMGITIVK